MYRFLEKRNSLMIVVIRCDFTQIFEDTNLTVLFIFIIMELVSLFMMVLMKRVAEMAKECKEKKGVYQPAFHKRNDTKL